MSDPQVDADVAPQASAIAGDWRGEADQMPPVARYAASVALVAAAAILAFVVEHLVSAPNLTLIFVLPVVIAAASFGWGPALAASVTSVVAFDFFFTEPRFSLAIAGPSDLWAATLFLVTAAIVSTVATQARRRALEARRAAEQAEALHAFAHLLIEGGSQPEIVRAAATALSRIFRAPAVVMREAGDALEVAATARAPKITDAEKEAARGALASSVVVRAETYPYDRSTFDFWAIAARTGERYVLGVDFTRSNDGRPDTPERFVDLVGAYLAVGGAAIGRQQT